MKNRSIYVWAFKPNMAERISSKCYATNSHVQLSGREWTRKYQGRKHHPSVSDNKCPASRNNNTLKMPFPMDNSGNALFLSQFQPANRNGHNKTLQNHPSSASTTPDSARSYASIACMPPVCPNHAVGIPVFVHQSALKPTCSEANIANFK